MTAVIRFEVDCQDEHSPRSAGAIVHDYSMGSVNVGVRSASELAPRVADDAAR